VRTQPALPDFPGLAGCAAAIVILGALAWSCLDTSKLPPPASATAPAAQFSAERAMRHVRAIASTPRPIASPMNAGARDFIVRSLREIGLEPEVQSATVQTQTMDNRHNVHVTLAVVHNVVVRKAGMSPNHASTPAVLVATNYDSKGDALGAADSASAAAMLETLRALQAGAPLSRDVIFLFADGDNVGALGEQAFAEQHPLARQVSHSLVFHHLGNGGPVVLLNAHGGASGAISAWAKGAPQPRGSSLIREATAFLPNARGASPLAKLDAPLLEFAAVEGKLGRFDTPDLLDKSTLQHEGDTMLELVRSFARKPLAPTAGHADEIYFALPLIGMIHYSANLVWPLTGMVCLLVAGVCWLSIERAESDPGAIARGAFGYALVVGLPLGIFYLDGLHGILAELAGQQSGQRYAQGTAMLMASAVVLLQRRLCKRVGALPAALGALVWLSCMLVAISWGAPGASYVLAWPLVAAALSLAALHASGVRALPQWAQAAVMVAGIAPALLLIVPAARDTFSLLTPFRMHLPMWLLAALLGLGLGLLHMLARRFTVRACALAGLGLLALPGAARAPEPDPPRPNPLVYYKHMPTWSEWWIAHEPALDDWSRALFPGQPKPRRLVDIFGWDSDDIWYARATRADAIAFPYAVLNTNSQLPKRFVEFDLTSKNSAPHIEVRLFGGKPRRAFVNGRLLSDDDQIRNWSLSLYGMEEQQLHFRIDLIGDPILVVGVEEHMPGVPKRVLPAPLPKGAFIPMTEQTVTSDYLWFR
jgi:hypothetical protein